MNQNLLTDQISNFLPKNFDFYEYGHVKLEGDSDLKTNKNLIGVAFSVYFCNENLENDSLRTLILVIFENNLETEMYTELGNIIASRFANQMGNVFSDPVMITPPLLLKAQAIQRLLKLKKSILSHKKYLHIFNDKEIPIETVVLKDQYMEKGHA